MPALRRRLLADCQRRGLSPRTPPCDLDAVTHLAQHSRWAPDHLSAAELRHYCLDWLHETQVAESTVRIHLEGIRCCYERTLRRPWPICEFIR
jgi:hypothetical protein